MPQIFRVGAYLVYFWSNENYPLEPVHVHITQGTPSGNATKVWITRQGKCLLAHNNSKIPERMLPISWMSSKPDRLKSLESGKIITEK